MTTSRARIRRPRIGIGQVLLLLFLFALCILMILPFSWIFSTSLRLESESFKMPPDFFPTSFRWENYATVFEWVPFGNFIFNSVKIAVIVVIASVIISTMAGYAFARIPFKGKGVLFMVLLAELMVPAQATLIPTYIIMSRIGLVGTHWSLILLTIISPLSIFFVRQYMMTIPASYEEAAYIDGATRFTIYRRVFLPMSKPVIFMTALQTFMASWNDFLRPLIFLSKWEMATIPLGLKILNGNRNAGNIAVVFAGVSMSLVVPFILYFIGQKYIIQGIALTGLKS